VRWAVRSARGLLGELGLALGELGEMVGFLLPECWPQKSAKGAKTVRRRTSGGGRRPDRGQRAEESARQAMLHLTPCGTKRAVLG